MYHVMSTPRPKNGVTERVTLSKRDLAESVNPTIRSLSEAYVRYVRDSLNLSTSTVKNSANTLRLLNDYFIGRDVTSITIQELEEYFQSRLKDISQASLNTERSYIRRFLLYTERYLKIKLDFDPALIRNAKVPEPEIRFHDTDKVETWTRTIKNDFDRLVYLTLFYTGMRVGELVRFRVTEFHGDEIIILNGKGGKDRVIPIPIELSIELNHHINKNGITEGCVFRRDPFSPYSISGLRKRLYRNAVRENREYFNPHSMRHSVATALLKNGMDIRSVQVFLGHSHIQTTMRYLHVTDQHLKQSYNTYVPILKA